MKHVLTTMLLVFFGFSLYSQDGIDVTKNISCHDGNDGELTVKATFGTAPYTYGWKRNGVIMPTQIQKVASGLDAGLYSVTVTDALLVSQTFTYTLDNPLALTATYAIVPNSTWPTPNGGITITPSGGTGWLDYQIIDSTTTTPTTQTTNVFSNLFSGRYYITISDVKGCLRQDTVVVPEASGISTSLTIDYTACYEGTANISVRPNLILGNLPADIEFPNDTITIVKVIPGFYITNTSDTLTEITYGADPGQNLLKVITNDNKGFRYSWTVLRPSNPITLTLDEPRNVLCYGANTGFIHGIRAQGSYGTFTYSTLGPNGFSSSNQNLDNLRAGIYLITATDSSQNCSTTLPVTILQPNAPLQGSLAKKDLTCFHNNDGSITGNFTGGTGQLTYLWDSGQTTASLTSLAAGTYTLTVTDANGCTLTPPAVTINEPARLHVTDVVVPVACYNYSNASITTTVVGGNGGNSFVWKKDGEIINNNTNTLTGLGSGIYALHLKDSVGCVFDTTWTLSNPLNFQFEFVNTPISCNDELGTIRIHNLEAFPLDVTIGGVTQTVAFDDTTDFGDLPIGGHLVSISNGVCTFDTTIIFTQPLPLVIAISPSHSLCYDGRGSVEVHVSGGTSGPNSTLVLDGTNYLNIDTTVTIATPANDFIIDRLKAGSYDITVTDDNGCMAVDKVIIEQPNRPRAFFSTEKTTCPECQDGKAMVLYVIPFQEPNTYVWNTIPIQTTQEADSLAAGWHYVQTTDANGCVVKDSVEVLSSSGITIPNTITPNGDGKNDVLDLRNLCYNANSVVFVIKNRDNSILFETTDPSEVIWYGKDKSGKLLPSRSFVYLYLEIIRQDGSKKRYLETITVLY